MYGDSRENSFEILAVVIILSPISSVCGFICVSWLIHMCVVTHSYVCHDSFICVSWLIHMCVITHSYVCGDSCVCVSWRNVMVWFVTKHHCVICDICAYSSWRTCMLAASCAQLPFGGAILLIGSKIAPPNIWGTDLQICTCTRESRTKCTDMYTWVTNYMHRCHRCTLTCTSVDLYI